MTAAQSILATLTNASGGHLDAAFPWAELVVLVWQADPARFGMKGYPYPDAKRICAEVSKMASGTNGHSIRAPLLKRVEQGLYRLTAAGLDEVRILEASTRKGAA